MTSRCRACGVNILWLEKPGGGYNRPVEKLADQGFRLQDGQLVPAGPVFKQHECDKQLQAELQFRDAAYNDAVRSIDCPHPRCAGVVGGPCISLLDGATELRSYHPERIKAVPRDRFPKPFGGKL